MSETTNANRPTSWWGKHKYLIKKFLPAAAGTTLAVMIVGLILVGLFGPTGGTIITIATAAGLSVFVTCAMCFRSVVRFQEEPAGRTASARGKLKTSPDQDQENHTDAAEKQSGQATDEKAEKKPHWTETAFPDPDEELNAPARNGDEEQPVTHENVHWSEASYPDPE
jgi:hypothetical protein